MNSLNILTQEMSTNMLWGSKNQLSEVAFNKVKMTWFSLTGTNLKKKKLKKAFPLVQSNPMFSFPRNTHRPPPLSTSMDPFPQATSQGFEALDSTARKSTNDYLQTQGESPPPFSKKLPTNTLLRAKKRTTSHGRFIRDLIRTSPALIFLSKRVRNVSSCHIFLSFFFYFWREKKKVTK